MTGEKVSVIIPAYNSSRTIYSAVDSVMKQGIPVEVIIVDDCSTDDLTGALDGYAEDDRVNIIRNEKIWELQLRVTAGCGCNLQIRCIYRFG